MIAEKGKESEQNDNLWHGAITHILHYVCNALPIKLQRQLFNRSLS